MSLWEQHQSSGWNPFKTYRVEIEVECLVGGKPATTEMVEAWVSATCKKKSDDERQRIVEAHLEQLDETTDEVKDKQSNVFGRVNGQLVIEGRQLKAMLKEAANIIKDVAPGRLNRKTGKEEKGIHNFRSKMADQVFVTEETIPLDRTEPDEINERPIHVMTAQGPRSSIKRTERVLGARIAFTVKRRYGAGEGVPEKALLAVLDYAQSIGLGAERSLGRGKFRVLSVEKVD